MVALAALWLPILVAAVLVFIASSVIHMFLPYHRSDYNAVPSEDAFMADARKYDIPPGEYVVPYAGGDPEVMKSQAFQEKAKQGPVLFMTVLPKGDPFAMGGQLVQWFVYCLVVSLFCAYVASRALGGGGEYLDVFRFAGTTAFACYAVGQWQRTIWFHQPTSTAMKNTFDGLVYALLTAGAFGWLWPM